MERQGITKELAETLGVDRRELGRAIHRVKKAGGLGGADNVTIGLGSGDVYDSRTGEIIGNILDEIGR